MIRNVLFALAAMLLIATSCKKEDENHLPTKPKPLTPAKGAVVDPQKITFTWETSTDADGEEVYHSLELSSDSSTWQPFSVGTGTSKTIVNKQGSGSYYAFEPGKKYYWKLSVDSKDANGQITGSNESDVVRFYTTPTGVANLSKTSGNGFVNLAWTDPAGLSKVEVTFSPTVSGISQPIAVNPGVGKVELQGMANSTIYNFYVKAYNSLGHTSKADTIKAMPLSPTLVHDADFNIYSTVKIGTQTWMRENLRTTRWQDGSIMKDSYGFNYSVGSKSDIYGLYYSSYAAEGGRGKDKNPCPCGYHVPTDEEFKALERFLGMPEEDISNSTYPFIRGEDEGVGNLLKSSTGWDNWNGVSGNGLDIYGFNLRPAGSIYYLAGSKMEEGMGTVAYLYTKTSDGFYLIDRYFSSATKGLGRGNMAYQVSIRCVKD